MKKPFKVVIGIIGLALLAGVINHVKAADQIVPQVSTNVVVTVPPKTWTGTNADCIGGQLLSITNLDGTKVVPGNFFQGHRALIILDVRPNTNGYLQSITATVR